MEQCYLVNPQFGLIAEYMAIVLSSSDNIELLIFLVKLAIAIGAVVMVLILIFWFRLKKIEKRMYLVKKPLKHKLAEPKLKKHQKSLVTTQVGSHRPISNLKNLSDNHRRSPINQGLAKFSQPLTKSLTKVATKSTKRSSNWRWLWLFAIASLTGIAIALMQSGNSFVSPEIAPFVWFFIGVMLVVSATCVEIA